MGRDAPLLKPRGGGDVPIAAPLLKPRGGGDVPIAAPFLKPRGGDVAIPAPFLRAWMAPRFLLMPPRFAWYGSVARAPLQRPRGATGLPTAAQDAQVPPSKPMPKQMPKPKFAVVGEIARPRSNRPKEPLIPPRSHLARLLPNIEAALMRSHDHRWVPSSEGESTTHGTGGPCLAPSCGGTGSLKKGACCSNGIAHALL